MNRRHFIFFPAQYLSVTRYLIRIPYHGEMSLKTILSPLHPLVLTLSPWTGSCCYRHQCHWRTWPWTSAGRSGSTWTLLRGACTGMWPWRTTATCAPWVRHLSLCPVHLPGASARLFPFSAAECSGTPDVWDGVILAWESSVLFHFCDYHLLPVKWDHCPISEHMEVLLKGPQTQLAGPNPVSRPVNRVPRSQTRGHLQVGARRRAMDVGGGNPTSEVLRWASVTWADAGHGSRSQFSLGDWCLWKALNVWSCLERVDRSSFNTWNAISEYEPGQHPLPSLLGFLAGELSTLLPSSPHSGSYPRLHSQEPRFLSYFFPFLIFCASSVLPSPHLFHPYVFRF